MSIQKIWFPQIAPGNINERSDIVVDTLRRYFELFAIPTTGSWVPGNSFSAFHDDEHEINSNLFNIESLISLLSENKTILAFGTFSTEQLAKYSFQELGFNLLNLVLTDGTKIFNYFPFLPSVDNKDWEKLFSFKIETIDSKICQKAIELLKWSRCHKACLGIQDPFGHGYVNGQSRRDWLQTLSCQEILNRVKTLKEEHVQKWCDLHCGTDCQLLQKMTTIITSLENNPYQDKPCPGISREIAFIDCRKYRIAQSIFFAQLTQTEASSFPFKHVVILDDNQGFREKLKEDLLKLGMVNLENQITEADPQKSLENCCLSYPDEGVGDTKKKDILATLIEDKKFEHGDILTCFDLDLGKNNLPKTVMGNLMQNIFGGHWILYKTMCNYPGIPRLVITGYRSQDISSHIAGGSAFLMKPYTPDLLGEQIKQARLSVRRHVAWLCPRDIRENYSHLLASSCLNFSDIESSLKRWLDSNQINLDMIDTIEGIENHNHKDLIILDLFNIEEHEQVSQFTELREIIRKIRAQNPQTQFLLVFPFNMGRETTDSGYFRKLPLRLHDGTDKVIRKPCWITLDGKTTPEECLGDMILEQLAHKGGFDVKYQVIVPLSPVVGRLSNKIKDISENPGIKNSDQEDEYYAPLLPYLVEKFGLACRISDILNPGQDVKKVLLEVIAEEQKNDPDRWENITDKDKIVSALLDDFVEALKEDEIGKHITLERWLRYVVDMKPQAIYKKTDHQDIHSLTEPLARVFGGSTRYEFSVRGSWYKGKSRIDDILIVVEFCARSSIIGRKFIRETVVRYLREISGEDLVLVQEIPIDGFLWS